MLNYNLAGDVYKVFPKVSVYNNNKVLAILLYTREENTDIPFAHLTVNLGNVPYKCSFVNVNECREYKQIIDFLAKPCNKYVKSGYVTYPLYEFDLDVLSRYDFKGVEIYKSFNLGG